MGAHALILILLLPLVGCAASLQAYKGVEVEVKRVWRAYGCKGIEVVKDTAAICYDDHAVVVSIPF